MARYFESEVDEVLGPSFEDMRRILVAEENERMSVRTKAKKRSALRTAAKRSRSMNRAILDRKKMVALQAQVKDRELAYELLQDQIEQKQQDVLRLRAKLSEVREFEWLDAVGQSIKPEDFEEGHLRNTIAYISRRLPMLLATERFLNPSVVVYRPRPNVRYYAQALSELLFEAQRRGLAV